MSDRSDEFQEHLSDVIRSYGEGAFGETRYLLESLSAPDVANLLESTPPKVRRVVWDLLDEDTENRVLQHLAEDVRAEFLESMDTERLVAAADELDTDDFADLLQQLPDAITQRVLSSLDQAERARLETVLSYPEDTAGGLMNTDAVTVRPRLALEIVLRYLRLRKDLPDTTDALIVVNSRDEYVGMLPVTKVLTSDPSVTVREVMDTEAEAIAVDTPDTEVAKLFSEEDLVSAPVVDTAGRLLGRITIDDVVDVIIEDADEAVLARAGLDLDEDTFAPIAKSMRRRAIWLGINLITAFLAAAVINIFEETIARVVALAVLMPIVASMGGVAGTQTLTLVIRGIALGQVGRANILWLLNREFIVATLNGLLWATLVAVSAALAFQDQLLGVVIAVAMIINILVAAVAGSLLPSILNRVNIDPAIAGGVILTTITDVTGFFAFLGLASWAYA
ncbi:MAG: magnesium transporter [Pseudomonadales bacterium]|jgi:magnesium transporter|nr:magnesium transporter [Pseudomonadales bacterium]MDP6470840.1 magnesium transporter [Pseudomonadales bacterium]MDP6825975.1 magnesium transporter [Pseudomonadales bacterium]MDP6972287.1 magnesium transporter [Pseudomonadales bacterium]